MLVLHCISRLKGTSYKKLQDTATNSFISCCFTSDFTSADKYLVLQVFILNLHSTLD